MELTREFMLDRFVARDSRFDGRFLTGVRTTGIYCLPSCPARKPKAENVTFFATAEEARAAGLRACKRCRPDDFLRGWDPELELAGRIATAVWTDPAQFANAAAVARAFGLGSTRWTQLARHHFHRTPAELLAQSRVTRARELLVTSDLPVIDVAGEVGFESLSAFNHQFRRRVALRPSEYRRLRDSDGFSLNLPVSYPTRYVLGFLGRDPESPTEQVRENRVRRALRREGRRQILHLDFSTPREVRGRLSGEVVPAEGDTVAGFGVAHRLLGLAIDPAPFLRHLRRRVRGPQIPVDEPGLRIPQTPTVFEGLVWSLVGQQVNLAFAYALRRRLIGLFELECGGGLLAHPGPEEVASLSPEVLRGHQYSLRKAEYLIGIAGSIADGRLQPEHWFREPASAVERRLLAQRGFGPWSTHYVLMRALGHGNCLPVGDTGLGTALQRLFDLDARPRGPEVEELMRPFEPYRSLATTHLWHSLGAIA